MKKRSEPALHLWEHDCTLLPASGQLCGIDEVGRGSLAGNVVAVCVILDLNKEFIPGLNDSKKLSPRARETLFPRILEKAVAWSIGEATPEEIDRLNILQATFLAMRRALESLRVKPAMLLVDGNQAIPGVKWLQKTIIGGDGLSASIAAASVLAKVTRDRAMEDWDRLLPAYGFSRHKGYGTADHGRALLEHGPSSIHRRSFCARYHRPLVGDAKGRYNSPL